MVVPSLYLTTPEAAARTCTAYVRGGGHRWSSRTSPASSTRDDTVHAGRRTRARCATCSACASRSSCRCAPASACALSDGSTAQVWAEAVVLHGAEAVLSYVDGPAAGGPAVTRHRVGAGTAWYVSTRAATTSTPCCAGPTPTPGVTPAARLPDGVEVVRRDGDGGLVLVASTTATEPAPTVTASGTELLTGLRRAGRRWSCRPGEVRVVRAHAPMVASVHTCDRPWSDHGGIAS